MHCGRRRKEIRDRKYRGPGWGVRAGVSDLLRGEVLHPASHLVGARHQVLERELLVGDLARVEGVVHAGRPAGAQVLPQVTFGGVFHQDIERPCRGHTRSQSAVQADAQSPWRRRGLTVLRARSQQVDDVLVLADGLRRLRL